MTTMIKEKWMLRPATMDDAQAVADFLNECSMFDEGVQNEDAEDLRQQWQMPGMELGTDVWLAFDGEKMIGYVDVWRRKPYIKMHNWGRVHPDYRGQGLGSHLLALTEKRAGDMIEHAPANAKVALHQGTPSTIHASKALLETHGYKLVRHYLRMAIELDHDIPEPQFPEGITVRAVRTTGEDDYTAYHVAQESFKDHWGFVPSPFEEWQYHRLKNPEYDPSLYFIAFKGEEAVAVSLCWRWITEDTEMGWLGTLGVLRPYRKQGIAEALLYYTFQEFKNRGRKRVGLGVDASSLTGATKLYEKVGMRSIKQFDEYCKILRDGEELAVTEAAS